MTKHPYLLPGERDNTSAIVHTHGINRNPPIHSSQQALQHNFISIPRIYEPKERDFVIGIIIVRTPDLFLVDINGVESAVLPMTSFDQGRIPSRGAMNRLSVVYAHVVRADSWTQTELSCQSIDHSKRKNDFGLIEQGHIIRCSLGLCEKLQHSQLINQLTHTIKNLRIRITRNGFVWYMTDTINSMIAIKNVLYKHEYENNSGHLVNHYQLLMTKLQQQDDSLMQVKQHKSKVVKKEVEIKKIEQPKTSDAVTRLLHQVIKDVLNKIIDDIENNENR